MDLELDDDQTALRDGIRALLAGRFGSDRIREGFDAAMHAELAEAGVFSLRRDGFSWCDAAVVFEQLGEACVPGPLVAGMLAATAGIGDGIVGGIDRPSGGHPAVVEHLDALDTLLILDHDGIWSVPAASVAGTAAEWPLDPLTPVTQVAALPQGTPVGDAAMAAEWRRTGALLTAAFAMGMTSRLAHDSVEYAKQREQFDRAIGGFQAIKHMLADMAVRTELARAAVYAAAAQLDDPELPGLDRAVSGAKALACEHAVLNGKTATQVYGGMGFTWEVDVHLYLKRAWVIDTHFGSAESHFDRVAAAL